MNCLSSIRNEVNRIWPYTAVLSKSFNNYRTVTTQASTDEKQVTDEVLTQLFSAVENDPTSIKETCSTYIEKLCKAGSVSDAARLLRKLHDKQIFLNPKIYNMLLTVVNEQKNFEILSQVVKDVLQSCDLGSVFYRNLATTFTNLADSVQLLKFLDEVLEVISPKSTVILNKIIIGFAEAKQINEALLIFELMKDHECKPDLVTYNIILNILGHTGLVEKMLLMFTSMKESGLTPDIISYNTMINNLRKLGRLDLCLVFVKEMFEREVDPDLRTYTALIDSFGRSGRVQEALEIFGEMKRRGIHPSVYVYRSLISNSKKVGKVELAVRLLEEMNSSVSEIHSA